jgi:prephenate dehydrogenase
MFSECGIVGVGLIGGSLGLALRALGVRVIGLDSDAAALSTAVARGAIDRASRDARDLGRADLVILCVPPLQIASAAEMVMPFLKSGCLLTEVGSVKAPIAAAIERILAPSVRFLGMHPMCGTEGRGIESARADLFERAPLFLTPSSRTHPSAVRDLEELGGLLRMRVIQLTPEEHDRQVAAVSHLVYLLSIALTRTAPGTDCAGPAFRDATRVALSPTALWRQILSLNRDNLRAAIERLHQELDRISSLEGRQLEEALEEARTLRQVQGEQRGWGSGSPPVGSSG